MLSRNTEMTRHNYLEDMKVTEHKNQNLLNGK